MLSHFLIKLNWTYEMYLWFVRFREYFSSKKLTIREYLRYIRGLSRGGSLSVSIAGETRPRERTLLRLRRLASCVPRACIYAPRRHVSARCRDVFTSEWCMRSREHRCAYQEESRCVVPWRARFGLLERTRASVGGYRGTPIRGDPWKPYRAPCRYE